MRDLLRRIEKLEEQFIAPSRCTCSPNLTVWFMDSEPEPTPIDCPAHGRQRVITVEFIRPSPGAPWFRASSGRFS